MRTFVVRIVEPEPGEPLRGVVQSVGSDGELTFRDEAQLIALLRRSEGTVVGDGER